MDPSHETSRHQDAPADITANAVELSTPSRRSLLRATAAAGAAIGLAAASRPGVAEATGRRTSAADRASKATVVLAHGAFADSSSWDEVVTTLEGRGHHVISVAVPLRGVASDARYLSDVLRTVTGPVVLVGHSYGGAVISNTDRDAGDIRALVYVAAFAGEAGESCASLSGKFPGSTLGPTLTSVDLSTGGQDLYIDQAKYHHQFCADVTDLKAAQLAASQRPILESALAEPFGPDPLWKNIPSWFIWGEIDYNIPAQAHAFMAERANARTATEVAGASHVVGITHPHRTAAVIGRAASATAHSHRTS